MEKRDLYEVAQEYIDEEKGVNSVEEAIQGAKDIIAEDISDNAKYEKAPVPKEKKAGNNKNAIVNKAAII